MKYFRKFSKIKRIKDGDMSVHKSQLAEVKFATEIFQVAAG